MAEADGHLRQKLQQVLKLSKEKWDDARDHAMRAVVADNRMRIWYAFRPELLLVTTLKHSTMRLNWPHRQALLKASHKYILEAKFGVQTVLSYILLQNLPQAPFL